MVGLFWNYPQRIWSHPNIFLVFSRVLSSRFGVIYLEERRRTNMEIQVGRWDNSLAVRIPGPYAKELQLEEGTELEVTCLEGILMLRPRKHEYTLDELLA